MDLPVSCCALNPFLCTDASDLKTINIWSSEAMMGCGSLLPQNLPRIWSSVVWPSYMMTWSYAHSWWGSISNSVKICAKKYSKCFYDILLLLEVHKILRHKMAHFSCAYQLDSMPRSCAEYPYTIFLCRIISKFWGLRILNVAVGTFGQPNRWGQRIFDCPGSQAKVGGARKIWSFLS